MTPIYTETNYRLGAAKIQIFLQRENGVSISIGRVYRLIKSMSLPKMVTANSKFRYREVQKFCMITALTSAIHPLHSLLFRFIYNSK
ncbi:hypothetical protein [Enterococcus sp. DIV0086]|uniref:hypothetical protein n=1 Tax=Enterococcus sp. DIV0086 TaxID=2774655 RepID=UPI003D28E66F